VGKEAFSSLFLQSVSAQALLFIFKSFKDFRSKILLLNQIIMSPYADIYLATRRHLPCNKTTFTLQQDDIYLAKADFIS
jgi:hypothetical protein